MNHGQQKRVDFFNLASKSLNVTCHTDCGGCNTKLRVSAPTQKSILHGDCLKWEILSFSSYFLC